MKDDLQEKEEAIDVGNSTSEAITLWIEPWCLEFTVTPNDLFTIKATGPRRGRFIVCYLQNQITVCAWPGSTITVWKDDKEENIGELPRVPPIPGWEDLIETEYFKSINN
jgi:hypothetical protein